jgi:hypothetical protein
MLKKYSVFILTAACAFQIACGGPDAGTNTSTNTTGSANQANLPSGFSTSPLPVNGTTPGIPDPNMVNTNLPKGLTPTPGIPDPKMAGKPLPKGTPTPGIPSPEELKKMMANSATNPNIVNQPGKGPIGDQKPQKRGVPGKTP